MKSFLQSFAYAFRGIADLFRHHRNGQIHLVATILVALCGFFCHISPGEWMAVIICIATVTALEAMNSAIEYLTDLVSPDFHPLAGKVKDMAAGAVLISAIGAAVVGGIIFIPRLAAYLGF